MDAGNNPLGSPAGIADKIERTTLELKYLLDKHTDDESGEINFDGEGGVREALGQPDFGLTTAEKAAVKAIIDAAVARVGKPYALPEIARGDNNAFAVDENGERAVDENGEGVNVGVNADGTYDEDTEIEIDVEDWGFRDPAGNTDEAITELVSITVTSITLDGLTTNAGTLHLADGNGDALVADSNGEIEISADDLVGLYYKPAENQYGVIKITYTVNDGELSSDEAVLEFTIDSVNDKPSDILLTGDRSAVNDGDRADSTSGGLYVLVDGVIKAFNASNEIVDAGIVSHSDVEDNVGTYSLSGTHGDLFEIDANDRLKLIDPDTKLADGEIYEVRITYNDGGVNGEYFETYYIVQGGLYIQPAGTTDAQNRVYSQSSEYNTDVTEGPTTIGLVKEGYNGDTSTTPAGVAEVIGTFGDDDDKTGYTYEYKFTGTGNNNASFTLGQTSGLLTFIGDDSGDYESNADLTIEFTRTKATLTGFTGQENADASGDLGDADLRTFSYSDGGITIGYVPADAVADAAAASVILGATNTVTFTADAKGKAGNTLIVAYAGTGAAGTDVDLSFDPATNTLTITYEAGVSTIADLVDAFAADGVSADITSRFDLTPAGDTSTPLTTVFGGDGSGTFTGSSKLANGVDNAPTKDAVQASVTVADTSSVSILKFTAFEPGAAGNSFGIKIVEDSTIASTATSITFDDETGKFTITIGTSDTSTVTQAIAAIETAIEASSFTIDGVTGNFSTFITMENVAPDSVLGNSVNLNGTDVSLTGGLDDVEHRTIDVAAGTIYLPDGTEISFDAVTGLRITEESADSYVIVDDVEGDGTYEVRAVATLPDGDDYYVLGTVEPLAVPVRVAVQAKLVRATADGTAVTFTADTAGLAGNSESVTFVTGADGSSIVLAYASNVLTITHAADSTLAQLETAFDSATTDITSRFDLTIPDGAGATLLSDVFGAGTTNPLTGGADAVGTARAGVGTAIVNGGPTPTDGTLTFVPPENPETHQYVIKLENIDDNAPAFTSDSSNPVSVAENADPATVGDAGVIFTARAADADGEAIVYSLQDDYGLFKIVTITDEDGNSRGEVSLIN